MGRRRRLGTAADSFAVGSMLRSPASSRSERGYDRLAVVYHSIEWMVYGNQLQAARIELIEELPPWGRLLLLGDGDGRLLERLAQKQVRDRLGSSGRGQHAGITSVDQSASMLQRQRERMVAGDIKEGIDFIQADARHFEPAKGVYDVIVTPFFLDGFSEETLEVCLPQWVRGLRRGGTLYHVDFTLSDFIHLDGNVATAAWRRLRARTLLWAMHVFFRWQTGLENRQLVDTEAAITRCGLRKELQQIGCGGMTTTQIWRVAE